jgi:DNA polymerase III delta prime subunit
VRLVNLPSSAALLRLASSVTCAAFRLGDALVAARRTATAAAAIIAALEEEPSRVGAAAAAAAAISTVAGVVCNVDVGALLSRLVAGHTPAAAAASCASGGDGESGDLQLGGAASRSRGATLVNLAPWRLVRGDDKVLLSRGTDDARRTLGISRGTGSVGPAETAAAVDAISGLAEYVDYSSPSVASSRSTAASAARSRGGFLKQGSIQPPPPGSAIILPTAWSRSAHTSSRIAAPGAPLPPPQQQQSALRRHRPLLSSLSVLLRPSLPRVTWREVVGAAEAKRALHDMLLWPLRHAEAAAALGVTLPTGVLLYGPPGTGKTLLAKALATAVGARFLAIPIAQILRAGVGESERALVAAFSAAITAAPCVLFLDELQALFGRRSYGSGGRAGGGDDSDRMAALLTSQFLLCLDAISARARDSAADAHGTGARVFVLAATNVPGALDAALLRPGRFDRTIFVGLPDAADRRVLFAAMLTAWGIPDVNVGEETGLAPAAAGESLASTLAGLSEGFSGADVAGVGRIAASFAVRDMLARTGAGRDCEVLSAHTMSSSVTPKQLFAAIESMKRR